MIEEKRSVDETEFITQNQRTKQASSSDQTKINVTLNQSSIRTLTSATEKQITRKSKKPRVKLRKSREMKDQEVFDAESYLQNATVNMSFMQLTQMFSRFRANMTNALRLISTEKIKQRRKKTAISIDFFDTEILEEMNQMKLTKNSNVLSQE